MRLLPKCLLVITAIVVVLRPGPAMPADGRVNRNGHHHQHGPNEGIIEVKTNDLVRRPSGSQGSPSLIGSWGEPFYNPAIAIHTSVLPTGKVLMFSYGTGNPQGPVWLWDPITNTSEPFPVVDDIFCAGHAFLPDGRLFVAGGNGPAPPDEFRGLACTYIFDPWTEAWTKVEDMEHGRWYPTCIPLADGRIATFSGLNETDGEINEDIEVYEPGVGWQTVGSAWLPLYPMTLLNTDGDIFYAGPEWRTGIMSTQSWDWDVFYYTNYGWRGTGTWAPIPGDANRVIIAGGYGSGPTNTVEIIDLDDAAPDWQTMTPMHHARVHSNAVILPDSKILVIGGQNTAPWQDSVPYLPVYDAELYDPSTDTWTLMAPGQIPRLYHSTAVLLPDGRVLAGGTDGEFELEIYSPPYLFKGPRPVITTAPTTIYYGSTFPIEFTSESSQNTACLIRLSSVTHSINMEQRYVDLGDVVESNDPVLMSAPATTADAPAGYYMLFVVDSSGVPSESRMVRLMEGVGCVCDCHADPICEDQFDVLDVIATVNVAFRGNAPGIDPNPACPYHSTDVDCSLATDVLDVVRIVNVAFRGENPATEFCAPCP